MPFLAPVIAWLTELSFFEFLTVGALGLVGVKAVGNEIKSTIKEAVIPAAIIGGVIYFLVNKSKK
jgi:hypothetical protein